MKSPVLFEKTIADQKKYVIGYSTVRKTHCEIPNFVSHSLRILRFTHGISEWKIDGKIVTFYNGDIMLLSNLNKRNIHSILSSYITYELFDFYPSIMSSEQLWQVFYYKVNRVANDPSTERVNDLLDILKKEILLPPDTLQMLSIHHLLDLLATEFHRHIKGKSDLRFTATFFNISRSIHYLSEHFSEDVNIQDAAKFSGYSHEYFSRIFRRIMGVTPIQYLSGLRLENTLHLVNAENMTIVSAAYQSGFRSSSAFYKAFHTNYGLSPKQYLK